MVSSKFPERRRFASKMDPDCAICQRAATVKCNCEAMGLLEALRQAEVKVMTKQYEEIREWVRARAQDFVLSLYHSKASKRRTDHQRQMDRLMSYSFNHYNRPPHPDEIRAAQETLKRGINEDWQGAVYRYPEVLEYYYGLVKFKRPDDADPDVRSPPFGSPSRQLKVQRRSSGGGGGGGSGSMPGVTFAMPLQPPPLEEERRTPLPRRHSYRPQPGPPPSLPLPPSSYHSGYHYRA